jgi:hypothetical protein
MFRKLASFLNVFVGECKEPDAASSAYSCEKKFSFVTSSMMGMFLSIVLLLVMCNLLRLNSFLVCG